MTLRERVQQRLHEMGQNPKRALGQNFLISESVVERILLALKSGRDPNFRAESIVEVGPGVGSLTDELLPLAQHLTLIELDREFAQYWRQKSENVKMVEADALKLDWKSLNLAQDSILVGNLPYQIAASLVVDRCVETAGISRMILMFQKEVAQRLVAKPATSDYGLLSAVAQSFWRVEFVLEAGPRDFLPPPKVASRVLRFALLQPSALGEASSLSYLQFLKAAFSHRRKLVSNNWLHAYFPGVSGAQERIDNAMAELGFKSRETRAEEISPEAFLGIFLKIGRK